MHKRQKRADRESLLQGTDLPSLSVSKTRLPKAVKLPTQHKEPGHQVLTFDEPENREGQLEKPQRKRKSAPVTSSPGCPSAPAADSTHTPNVPFAWPRPPPYMQGTPPWGGYYVPQFVSYNPQTQQTPPVLQPQQTIWPPQPLQQTIWPPQPLQLPQQPQQTIVMSHQTPTTSQAAPSRQQKWRQRKAAEEDKDRQERGEPPIKRHSKVGQYRYLCSKCGKQKNSVTGHTQLRGKWYCPSSGISVEEWRAQL